MIGSVLGPVGAVFGAALGAFFGGFYGSIVSSKVAGGLTDKIFGISEEVEVYPTIQDSSISDQEKRVKAYEICCKVLGVKAKSSRADIRKIFINLI